MSAAVDLKVVGGGELLATPTHGALVWLLPCVYAFVFLQVTPRCKLLITVGVVAFEGVSRVEPHVGH